MHTPKRCIPRNWYTLGLCVVPLRLFVITSNPPFLTKLEKKSCALGQIGLDILVAPRLTVLNPHMRSSRGGWVIARCRGSKNDRHEMYRTESPPNFIYSNGNGKILIKPTNEMNWKKMVFITKIRVRESVKQGEGVSRGGKRACPRPFSPRRKSPQI